MNDSGIKECVKAFNLNNSDTKSFYKQYYKSIDRLNLRLKSLFDMGYFG